MKHAAVSREVKGGLVFPQVHKEAIDLLKKLG